MLLLNIDHIPGREIEALSLVKGSVVQCKSFGKDFMAGMKTFVGGEIESYTAMLNEARQLATKRWTRRKPWGRTRWSMSATPPRPSCRGRRRSPCTARR